MKAGGSSAVLRVGCENSKHTIHPFSFYQISIALERYQIGKMERASSLPSLLRNQQDFR